MDLNAKGEVTHVRCLLYDIDKTVSLAMHLASNEQYMQINRAIIQDPEYDAFIHNKKQKVFEDTIILSEQEKIDNEEILAESTQDVPKINKRGRKKQTA